MSHDEIVVQLRDIHQGPPAPWWPPAPGYYLVGLVVVVLVVLSIYLVRLHSRLVMRRAILRELAAVEERFQRDNDISSLQAAVFALFRRIAFAKAPSLAKSIDVDALGPILTRIMPSRERIDEIMALLAKDRFHKQPAVDGALLLRLSREQIKRCRI